MQKHKIILHKTLGVLCLLLVLYVPCVYAADLSSTSFIVRDPLVGTGGSYGTSASFASYGSGDMTSIGRGTSASFEGRYGFLWYPYVTSGVLSATASGADANLTWTASTAGGGWNISGYSIGKATASGGPYTYTSVGNVLLYSYTNQTPGLYCFVLRTLDVFNNVIATSSEQCITIQPTIIFSVSTNSIAFGTLTSGSARYATTSGGSGSNSVAHTMAAASNAPSGYTLTYRGATLTSGANTIVPATITNDADGTPGTAQFALSLSSSGSATIAGDYNQSSGSGNWKYLANTTDSIASTSGVSSSETFSARYLANIASSTPAGAYTTAVTYVVTGNF
jgi:hypothetical protein